MRNMHLSLCSPACAWPRIVIGLAFLFLLLGCLPQTAFGATWIVPDDAATIQAGIDSASAGDTVSVTHGTYNEWDIVMKSGVALLAQNTGIPDSVTIDALYSGRVFFCANADSNTILDGFVIKNGRQPESGPDTTVSGGAMYGVNCDVRVSNCRFHDNRAHRGGGAFRFRNSSPRFSDCLFDSNRVYNNHGGAVLASGSTVTCTGCTFIRNIAILEGGAVRCVSGSVTLTDCVFYLNVSAEYAAGALSLDCGGTVSNCIFDRNSAYTQGGAIAIYTNTPTIDSCTFYQNDADIGSGIYVYDANPVISNTIISSGLTGEAIACAGTAAPVLSCCDLWDNDGGDYVGCIAGQDTLNNNFSAAPRFCNAPGGDFSLDVCSPCIAAPGCGQVGVLGIGCGGATVWNVPGDAENQPFLFFFTFFRNGGWRIASCVWGRIRRRPRVLRGLWGIHHGGAEERRETKMCVGRDVFSIADCRCKPGIGGRNTPSRRARGTPMTC